VKNGSSPEREAALNASLVRAYPFVITIYTLIIVISAIGIVK
jgi:hypothetical protein